MKIHIPYVYTISGSFRCLKIKLINFYRLYYVVFCFPHMIHLCLILQLLIKSIIIDLILKIIKTSIDESSGGDLTVLQILHATNPRCMQLLNENNMMGKI